MNKRLTKIRISLGLNMQQFAEKLGVTTSAISLLENDKRKLSDQMINLICRTFNISEEWLRDGKGSMFSDEENIFLNALKSTYNLDSSDIIVLRRFIRMPANKRQLFLDIAHELFQEPTDSEKI